MGSVVYVVSLSPGEFGCDLCGAKVKFEVGKQTRLPLILITLIALLKGLSRRKKEQPYTL